MSEIIFVSVEIMLVQLSSVYLLYLPFSRELSAEQKAELRRKYLLLNVAVFAMNLFFFADELSYRAFKVTLVAGWVPYLLLSMTVIRNKTAQHIFVLGMEGLWAFMLHSFAGTCVVMIYGTMTEKLLPVQMMIYLLLYTALLKVERKFFINLLPTPKIFENRSLKWCVSTMPLAIFIGMMIAVIDTTFLPTWQEKFSRIVFQIFFLLMYRAMSISTRYVEETQRQEQRTRFLNGQLESLSEHNDLMQKSQREVSALREDLEKNYRVIDGLLNEDKISEAMTYIRQQAQLLDATTVKVYCHAPLVNAALSIYFRRAEEVGIKIERKIDLPEKMSTDENDLAVLVSNLLENAITASKQQDPSAREMSVMIRCSGGQYVLEISNRYDFPIKLGENGLPYTSKIGHGLGMSSLEMFAKKYDAYFDFSHENNLVQLSMYWKD